MTTTPSQPIPLESSDSRGEPASNSMADADLLSAIAEVRERELSMLTALPAAQWELPTLCDGWRVREVVAHQTMPFRYPGSRIALELLRSMGQFNRMADRIAKRDAVALSIEEQLTALRTRRGATGCLTRAAASAEAGKFRNGCGGRLPPTRHAWCRSRRRRRSRRTSADVARTASPLPTAAERWPAGDRPWLMQSLPDIAPADRKDAIERIEEHGRPISFLPSKPRSQSSFSPSSTI